MSIKRRKIDPETKMAAVLEGLRGESSIVDICHKDQISESLYYKLAGQVLGRRKPDLGFPELFWSRGYREGQDFGVGKDYREADRPDRDLKKIS